MKKLSILMLALAAIVVLACSANNVKYKITGVNAPEDGVAVYLIDMLSATPIDTAFVSGGNFFFEGKAGKNAYLTVHFDNSRLAFPLFNDGKPVQINLADSTFTGSELNTQLSECTLMNLEAYDAYEKVIADFEALPMEVQEATVDDFIPKYQAALQEYAVFYINMVEANMDNLIPVAFIDLLPSLVSATQDWDEEAGEAKFEEILNSGKPCTKHPYVKEIKRRMEESEAMRDESDDRKQSVIGQKFLDLEEAAPDGTMHKLSEYVGRGNWVLVDFWASWCGPCKAEMPNVVAAYQKYHDKGFDIVGLSFDQDKDAWVKAITDWEMPWIHLSDLKYWNTVASDVYSVDAIPDNLLIDPQGIIVARGLRGAALEARLAEIFE